MFGSTDSGTQATSGIAADTDWHLFEWSYDGTQLSLSVDGGAPQTAALTGAMDLSAPESLASIGGNVSAGNVDIAEVIMVRDSTLVTSAIRDEVIADLNHRYGQAWT